MGVNRYKVVSGSYSRREGDGALKTYGPGRVDGDEVDLDDAVAAGLGAQVVPLQDGVVPTVSAGMGGGPAVAAGSGTQSSAPAEGEQAPAEDEGSASKASAKSSKSKSTDLHSLSASEAQDFISTLENESDLAAAEKSEKSNPQYDGGRTTVLRAIEKRRSSLSK